MLEAMSNSFRAVESNQSVLCLNLWHFLRSREAYVKRIKSRTRKLIQAYQGKHMEQGEPSKAQNNQGETNTERILILSHGTTSMDGISKVCKMSTRVPERFLSDRSHYIRHYKVKQSRKTRLRKTKKLK